MGKSFVIHAVLKPASARLSSQLTPDMCGKWYNIPKRGTQTGTTGTDDEGVVFMVNDRILVPNEASCLGFLGSERTVPDYFGGDSRRREGPTLSVSVTSLRQAGRRPTESCLRIVLESMLVKSRVDWE